MPGRKQFVMETVMIQPPIRAAALALLLTVNGCGGVSRSGLGTSTPGISVAEAALQGGAGQVALQVSDAILREQPDNITAREIKGDALTLLGQYDQATAVFQALLAKNPDSVRANTGLGRIKLASDPAAAEALFQQILKRDPRDQTALNNLGIARDLQGRHAEAQTIYRQALAVNPELASAQVNMALSMAMSGQGAAAVQLLRPRATEAGASVKVKHDYAVVLAMAGQRAEAERVLGETMTPEEVRQALDSVTGTRTARTTAPDRREASRVAGADLSTRIPPDVVQQPAPVRAAALQGNQWSVQGGVQISPMALPPAGTAWTPGPAPQTMAPNPPPMVVRPQGTGMTQDVEMAVTPTAGSVSAAALSQQPEAVPGQDIRLVPRSQESTPSSIIIPPGHGQPRQTVLAPARPPEAASPVLNPPAAPVAAPMAAPVPLEIQTRPMPAALALPVAPALAVAPVTVAPVAAPPAAAAPRPAASLERRSVPPRPEAAPPRPREETLDLRRQVIEARDRYDPTAAALARHVALTGPVVQFSAAPSEAAAHALWQNLTQKFPAVLNGHERIVVRVERNGSVFWRLRTGGFENASEARALCARLRSAGQDCILPAS